MKQGIDIAQTGRLVEDWPGKHEVFSLLEYVATAPNAILSGVTPSATASGPGAYYLAHHRPSPAEFQDVVYQKGCHVMLVGGEHVPRAWAGGCHQGRGGAGRRDRPGGQAKGLCAPHRQRVRRTRARRGEGRLIQPRDRQRRLAGLSAQPWGRFDSAWSPRTPSRPVVG